MLTSIILAVVNVKVEVRDTDLGYLFRVKPNSLLTDEYSFSNLVDSKDVDVGPYVLINLCTESTF